MVNEQLPSVQGLRETGLVPEYCTCGAKLPPDALFCHKCGKPQREVVGEETPETPAPEALAEQAVAEPVAVAPDAAPAVPPEIGFHNRPAVRSSFLAAALSSLLISRPTPIVLTAPWMLVWLLFAGFLAVRFYGRRTGMPLTVRGGFRMGWITGIFCFVIAMVFFTITIISISSQEGLAAFYRKQFTGRVPAGVDMNQMLAMLESPAGLGVILIFALLMLFLIYTVLPTVGGGLAARMLARKSSTR
jgi:hypothetical protein